MRLSDLSPLPGVVTWEGEPVDLKPFCLRSMVWAERFFFDGKTDGFERMNRALANEFGPEVFYNTLLDIVYYLGHEDFCRLGVESPVIFKLKVFGSEKKQEIIAAFKTELEKVLLKSFPDPAAKRPEFKGGKDFGELNQGKMEISRNENWDQIYIEFFRTGGMTIDQFMGLTMRQIGPLLAEMQHKRTEDMNILSDLIHKKIAVKKPHRKNQEMKFSEKDVKSFEAMHARLVAQSRIN